MEETTISPESPGTANENAMQLVGFNIGRELFGVNILSVQEIIRTTPITPIPDP
jgi:chemotaxis signal transduction protein